MIEVDGDTVGDVLRVATELFGPAFAQLLATSRIWVNGSNADSDQPIAINDEVAVLPPVSGG
jgi:molybdopterin converting factor small subunit